MNPSNWSKVVRGILLAILALSLTLSSENGLDMFKTLSIVVGFPFAIAKVFFLAALKKALKNENPAAIDRAYQVSAKKIRV